jgi:hypothetical protein
VSTLILQLERRTKELLWTLPRPRASHQDSQSLEPAQESPDGTNEDRSGAQYKGDEEEGTARNPKQPTRQR